MKHLDQRVRVPIEDNNLSICRDETRCIKCSNCSGVCERYSSVLSEYNVKTLGHALCVNCGQCAMVCPTGAIHEVSCVEALKQDMSGDKIAIISTSPAVRVSLGEEFGLPAGSMVEGKMVALLRKLGFKYVLDVNFGADVTTVEEASELLERKKNKQGVMFSSCCPAWVKFVEMFYPDMIDNLSSCKSPIGMQGALIKTYFASKMSIDPANIINVCLTPCVAKKMEINRPELCSSGIINSQDMRDMDYCLTVREVADWAKSAEIDFFALKPSKFDRYMSSSSGVGAMFGKTGGVSEAVITTIKDMDTTGSKIRVYRHQDTPVIKYTDLKIGEKTYKIASVFGLKNARHLIERIKNGEQLDFVEVMACPGGCVGGGGQPKTKISDPVQDYDRIRALQEVGNSCKITSPLSNPEIKKLYKDYLLRHDSLLASRLLHTHFIDRSAAVKPHKRKEKTLYKCEICGEVFERPSGVEPICPNCAQTKTHIAILN